MGKNKLKKSQRTIKNITFRALAMTLLVAASIFLVTGSFTPYASGYVLGGLVSVLNFHLMVLSLTMSLKKSKKSSAFGASAGYFLRYAIYGLILIKSIQTDDLNFLMVALGFFVIKISVISSVFFQRN